MNNSSICAIISMVEFCIQEDYHSKPRIERIYTLFWVSHFDHCNPITGALLFWQSKNKTKHTKYTITHKAQHEGALTTPCIVQKRPQVIEWMNESKRQRWADLILRAWNLAQERLAHEVRRGHSREAQPSTPLPWIQAPLRLALGFRICLDLHLLESSLIMSLTTETEHLVQGHQSARSRNLAGIWPPEGKRVKSLLLPISVALGRVETSTRP